MSKKLVFLNTDKLWYIATYNNSGDFSSMSERGYETHALANQGAGFPEGTPAGELIEDEEIVASADEARNEPVTTEHTLPVEAEATVDTPAELATVPAEMITTEMVEAGVTTDTPLVNREDVVAELGEAKVVEIEASAQVDTVKDETPEVNTEVTV